MGTDGSLEGVRSGLCLDVYDNSTANGSTVGLWRCNGQTNQRWTVPAAADTTPPGVPANPRTSALTCQSVTFAWDAATDAAGVVAYDVFHDGQRITSVSGSVRSTSVTVVPGVTWGLYVQARDAAGNVSQASTSVKVTPPPCSVDTEPPSTPTGWPPSRPGPASP